MNLRIAALIAALSLSPALAAPPTDQQIDDLVQKITETRAKTAEISTQIRTAREASKDADTSELTAKMRALNDETKGLVEKTPLAEASLPQIEKLVTGKVMTMPEINKALAPRLAELSKAATVDGARAAELRVANFPAAASMKPEDRKAREADLAKAYVEALSHPGLADLMNSGRGDLLLRQIAVFTPEVIKENKLAEAVEPLITTKLSVDAAMSLGSVVDKVVACKLDPKVRDRILDKAAAASEAALKSAAADTDAKKLERVRDAGRLAKSGWARGTLIGSEAPDIKFTWTSGEMPKSLAAYKGKVVMLDFWATWCGPCVASFPKMRELQERYKDYPVAIIGVTSIQGYHMKRTPDLAKAPTRIDTKGDPQKEMAMMPEFIKDMDMTWPVAFSDDGCFNPFYGVRGIPHLAIIDPSGKVVFNELRPGDPAEEADKIDKILKDFKLSAPPQPMEHKTKPKKEDAGS